MTVGPKTLAQNDPIAQEPLNPLPVGVKGSGFAFVCQMQMVSFISLESWESDSKYASYFIANNRNEWSRARLQYETCFVGSYNGMKYVYPRGETCACIIFSRNEYMFGAPVSICGYSTMHVRSAVSTLRDTFIAINENFHQCNAVVHPCVFNWIHLAFVMYRNELQHGLFQCNLNAAHYVRSVHSMCRREAITSYGLVSKSADLLRLWLNLSWWSVWTNAMLN